MRRVIALLAVLFALALPVASASAVTPYSIIGGGGGFSCTHSDIFFGLGNLIHPNWVGEASEIDCNGSAAIRGSTCLLHNTAFGWVFFANSCGVLNSSTGHLTTYVWYSCVSVASLSIYEYQGIATWGVTVNGSTYYENGANPQSTTAIHDSKCNVGSNPMPVSVYYG